MTDPRKPAFDRAREVSGSLDAHDVAVIHAALDAMHVPREELQRPPIVDDLTPRVVNYLAGEEWLVAEAYKDSSAVWTWALGVTNASGHIVYPRYKDNPQSLERCIEVSVWLMRQKYLPAVLAAFAAFPLTEEQLAAALSFHWNTGSIGKTDWVDLAKAGKASEARAFLETHYLNDGKLTARRKREAALFFDGTWPDKPPHVCPVSKPSYTPNWSKAQKVDLLPIIKKVMG